MATLPAYQGNEHGSEPRAVALSSSDQQARILRAALAGSPDGSRLELAPGFALEPWERALLHREARFSRDPRGEALTLLHVRAAEWAVLEALALPGGMDAARAESAGLLLDRALADIGTVSEVVTAANAEQLEAIAERLHQLYLRVTETSLKLAQWRVLADPLAPWLVELTGDEFPIQDEREAARPRPQLKLAPRPAFLDEADAFEIEGLEELFGPVSDAAPDAAAVTPEPVALPVPVTDLVTVVDPGAQAEAEELVEIDGLDLLLEASPMAAASVTVSSSATEVRPAPTVAVAVRPSSRITEPVAPSARPAAVAAVPAPGKSATGRWVGLAAAASIVVAVAAALLTR